LRLRNSEVVKIDAGPSGKLSLLQSMMSGIEGEAAGLTLAVRPGRYKIAGSYVEKHNCVVIIRDFLKVDGCTFNFTKTADCAHAV
jgi:hypothetical protein